MPETAMAISSIDESLSAQPRHDVLPGEGMRGRSAVEPSAQLADLWKLAKEGSDVCACGDKRLLVLVE